MKIKIGRRALNALPQVTRPTVFYDSDLTGFGLKASATGALSYIVEYRPGAGGRRVAKRRMVIGTPKNLTPEEARNQASGLLARVRLGEDPAAARSQARKAEDVKDLLKSFMDDHVRSKRKTRTAKLFQGYVDNHINPAIGGRKAPDLSRSEVERLHRAIGKKNPVTANRVLALLGAAFAYGCRSGRIPEQTLNPARGIEKFREQVRERFLTESELLRLGEAIREAETLGISWSKPSNSKHARKIENRKTNIGPHAAAALRLLIFTGARLREILDLRWEYVDLQRGLLFLPDSKTGKKTIVLGSSALAVLETLPRVGAIAQSW